MPKHPGGPRQHYALDIEAIIGYVIGVLGIGFAVVQWRQGRGLSRQIMRLESLLAREADRHAPETAVAVVGTSDLDTATLAAAIAELPEREKLILTLLETEGLTFAEVGEVLGMTPASVAQIHTQTIQQLHDFAT